MSATELLNKLPAAFKADEAAGTNCTLQFKTSEPTYVTIKDSTCTVTQGTTDNADVTVTMEDDDLVQMLKGELNGMTAFMTGKLQIDGDMILTQKVFGLFDSSKLA